MKEVLSENNIKYMYVDICEGVGKLKSFLKVRDTAPEMQEVREQHRAGIPCLVVDDQVILVNGAEHMQQLIEQCCIFFVCMIGLNPFHIRAMIFDILDFAARM